MKLSTLQMIAILCILAVGFMTAAPFLQTAEAGWTKKITTTYSYECILHDGTLCTKVPPYVKIDLIETWWHRHWNHQEGHSKTREKITKHREEEVDGCSECDPPSL